MFVADWKVATATAEEGSSPFLVAAEKTTAVAGEVSSAALEGLLPFYVVAGGIAALTETVQEGAVLEVVAAERFDNAEEGTKQVA